MFIRTVVANTSKGPTKYLQLCHNYRDKSTRVSKTKTLYNFGRADQLDVAAIRRLINSLHRIIPDESGSLP